MSRNPEPPESRLSGNDPEQEEEYVPVDDAVIGRAFRWSLVGFLVIAVAIVIGVYVSREEEPVSAVIEREPIRAPERLIAGSPEMPEVRFSDVTREAGIEFRHSSGATGEKLLPETMGGGVAFLDFDGDEDQDLMFVNSDTWPRNRRGVPRPTMALYRNDGRGRFEEVTSSSGLDVAFYGMGAAVGDYDGDGDTDLFLSALGGNHLYRNDAGVFRDVTQLAGVAGDPDAWSTSAGFFDYDGDGDLDLFVCNYIQWTRELDLKLNFTLNGVDRAYGPPMQYRGTFSYLYRNEGDGTFSDVSQQAGIRVENPATGEPAGKALAVTFTDPDRDGRLDILVANDTVQNFFFHNRGDGTFEEMGAVSGIGFDNAGAATGAMGVDAGEFSNAGKLGIGIGNFANEATSFYVQQRDPLQFADMSGAEGIGSPSRLKLSFGLFFFDYDLDGWLDIFQANGHLEDEINSVQPSQTYRQPAQLFWNCGPEARACYAAVPDSRAGDLARPVVGRGAAYADIDADGDLDVVLTQTGDRPLLLRNDQSLGHHWLRVRLEGSGSNRDAIGAEVELTAGGITQRRVVMPTRSYLSQVERPVTFGLGKTDQIESLRVLWPDGAVQRIDPPKVDQSITISRSV